MQQYLDLMREVLETGADKGDRTGVGTRSLFGKQLRFNLQDGFPLITTKKVSFHNIVTELIWFLNGDTNIKFLHDNNVHIWDSWADKSGELGPIYGEQWRSWSRSEFGHVDQIHEVIANLKADPDSRRHVVSAWNPAVLPLPGLSPQENVAKERMALAPCHCLFQFYVSEGALSCQMYQRSADFWIGVPYNIASYALLTHMIADLCDLEVGDYIHTFGDVHLYNSHIESGVVEEQLSREPKPLPTIAFDPVYSIHDYRVDSFQLVDYHSHPALKAEIAV